MIIRTKLSRQEAEKFGAEAFVAAVEELMKYPGLARVYSEWNGVQVELRLEGEWEGPEWADPDPGQGGVIEVIDV